MPLAVVDDLIGIAPEIGREFLGRGIRGVQAKRLRLSLNVGFHEIEDPRGMCKDVSGLGRWGNGDVEVGLSSADELPYIMGLVRQSFERQMGNGESN